MDSETYWSLVGDGVQCHFLYESILTKKQFKKICEDIRREEKERKNRKKD